MLSIQCTQVNKPGHINNPLDSAVWAELNNCSGIRMESIIINFYSIIDFHSKFCQFNRGISNNIEITLSFFFLTVSAMLSSQIILYKLSWRRVPCMQGTG